MTVVLGALRKHKYEFIEVYKEEASTALKAVVKQVNCLFFGCYLVSLW